jgi:hypothetical protein
MSIKALFSLLISAVLVLGTGCVNTETGHPTGGVPWTKDTITSRYEKPVAQLAAATRVVLSRNGKLVVDNVVDNTFEARVNQRKIFVKVQDLDGRITMVAVQARSSVGGDIDLAAEISKQIALQLMAGTSQ